MKSRERTASTAAVVVAIALVSAGCGDSGDDPEPVEPALIPARVAERLAQRSDEVGTLLEQGSLCDAAAKADELADEVEKAGKQIPAELRAELEQGAEQLVNTVNCPPPPEEPEKDKEEKDKDKDEGDEGDGGYEDEPLLGEEGPGNSGNSPGHNKGGD